MLPDKQRPHANANLLLCYIEGYPEPVDEDSINQILVLLDRLHEWVMGPPELINEYDGEDQTLGILLRLPKITEPLDIELERRALADVEAVIEALKLVTKSAQIEIAIELDGVVVGWVENGESDELLTQGLLTPWRSRLEEQS